MNTSLVVVIVIVFVLVLWLIMTFNSLIRLRNDVKKAFSGIDVQLKRRTDLIPNLINVVKGYAKHEKELFEDVTKARTSIMSATSNGNIKGMAQGENMLNGALKSLFAVAENYPDLKANENFLNLQEQLSETEDQIAASRRIYNENTTYFNTKIESFPSNIIAGMFNFRQRDLFEVTGVDKKDINVKI